MIEIGKYLTAIKATNNSALILYADLCGTTALYRDESISVNDQALRMISNIFEPFVEAFENTFVGDERNGKFYINIFGDSIILAERQHVENVHDKLLLFIFRYFNKLIFNTYCENGVPLSIACRAIITKGPIFSFHLKDVSEASVFNSKYVNSSLCGGRTLIKADQTLKGLPIGIYVTADVKELLNVDNSRYIQVGNEKLWFVKYKESQIDINTNGVKLRDFIMGRVRNMNKKEVYEKWQPWIEITEGKEKCISRRIK